MTKYPIKLKDGLALTIPQNDDDIERLGAFNGRVHEGEDLDGLVRALIREHPYGKKRYWWYIEETRTKRIVSALSLIPWRVNFCGAVLDAAELGFVGTLPAFRKQGLSRLLTNHFHETVEQEGFAFSFLQGIPFYYRQFGYEYAVQLENHFLLPLSRLPGRRESPVIRRAVSADTPRLRELYEKSMRAYPLHNARSREVWDFLLGPSLKTEMIHDTFCVQDGRGKTSAYFRVAHHGFGEGLVLDEISPVSPEATEAVLGFLKRLAIERRKPHLRINLHRSHPLARQALEKGAADTWKYAWQIRIGNCGRFLKKVAPVLEGRLANGARQSLSRTFVIDLYREAWALEIGRGRIKSIARTKRVPEGALCLPPFAAVQLFLGHRSLAELADIYPDAGRWVADRRVWEALFPVFNSWLHTNY
jgi:GNAT superfamily N-acetyltransferase